jgi:PAS domain S-box-containing protein
MLWLPIFLAVLLIPCSVFSENQVTSKNVLILESFSDPSLGMAKPLESELRSRVPWSVNFYVEYLESRRFDDAGYENGVFETLRHTYLTRHVDLVMPESYPALQFALKHRNKLFPDVPIVFWDVDVSRVAGLKMGPGVTGVTDTAQIRPTIDLALGFHPDTNTIAVVTNNSEFERYWLGVVHAELLRHQDKIKEIDLVALPPSQLLERVATLPPQTVVLFQEAPQASNQPVIGEFEALAWIGERFPTYCIFPVLCLNHGGIGGVSSGWKEQPMLAAEVGGRILSGERPEDIPIVKGSSKQVRVDWRQLHRWKIAESKLPPDSDVLYREPTVWKRYQSYIVAGIAVILLQAIWIVALLWQRARKRKAEAGLRESEKRFRVMADTTPSLIWMCDEKGQVTYLNDRRVAFTGPDTDAGYGDTWTEYVHPDDLKHVVDSLYWALKSRQSFSKEYRLRRYDGVYRWMFDVVSPRVNGDGSFAGFIGSAIDVTDQKLAQEALEKVGGRLIEAQEAERRRIARELHDDISQKLALLSMEIAQMHGSADASPEGKARLEEIRLHCSDVADDVQSLSHQLHSSKLDYLGVGAAIRGYCQEFARQYEIDIDFKEENLPAHLPRNISLCLFRVAQEALHNAVKYSGTREFWVQLDATDDHVELVVTDAGAGFDVEEAKGNSGLGLVSMQERVHLIGGQFHIESKLGEGTQVVVSVPLNTSSSSTDDSGGQVKTVAGAA